MKGAITGGVMTKSSRSASYVSAKEIGKWLFALLDSTHTGQRWGHSRPCLRVSVLMQAM